MSFVNISWTVSDVCVLWLLLSLNDLLPCAFSPNQHLQLRSICVWPLHSIPWCPGILSSVDLSLLESFPFYLLLDMAKYTRCVASVEVRLRWWIIRTPWPSEEQLWQRAPSINVVSVWICANSNSVQNARHRITFGMYYFFFKIISTSFSKRKVFFFL